MSSDTWSTLCTGVRFNKKRFADDFGVFKGGVGSSTSVAAPLEGLAPVSSLDFFSMGAGGTESSEKQDKSEKKQTKEDRTDKEAVEAESEDSGSADGSSSASESDGDDGVVMFKGSKQESSKRAKSKSETLKEKQRIEGLRALRRRVGIKVTGSDVPEVFPRFEDLPRTDTPFTREKLLRNIEASEFKEPTAVQMQSLPTLLSGRDVIACAPTGSGKTAAFMIPLLLMLGKAQKGKLPRALVLAPTLELAEQIKRETSRLCAGLNLKVMLLTKSSAAGAVSSAPAEDGSDDSATESESDSSSDSDEVSEFTARGRVPCCDLLVSTPARLCSAIGSAVGQLKRVKHVVLDEADKLLDDTFLLQVDTILAACDRKRMQCGMFSATMHPGVEDLASSVLRDPVKVIVGARGAGAKDVDQQILYVGREEGKILALRQMFTDGCKPPLLVFVRSKERAKELLLELAYDSFRADAIHGDRSATQRAEVVRKFRAGDIWMLIATDVVGRGIDFKGVNTVINYDFPDSAVGYVHRIGRTGRAGRKGTAITYFTEDDLPALRSIANVMRISGCEVPEWMLSIKKMTRKEKREWQARGKKHIPNSAPGYERQKAARKRRMIQDSKDKHKRMREEAASGGGGGGGGGASVASAKSAVPVKSAKSKHRRQSGSKKKQ